MKWMKNVCNLGSGHRFGFMLPNASYHISGMLDSRLRTRDKKTAFQKNLEKLKSLQSPFVPLD